MVFLGVDPAWDALRGLPRFTGLLKQMISRTEDG
jgi:hypothetical protein